jgi:pimeloyl-ACP methyl ester carboxylesterase
MPDADTRPPALADHVAGEGPPLLLVHGGTGSHRHWERVFATLAQAFEVHAPDLPGYGLSPDVPDLADGQAYVALAAASLSPLVPAAGVHLVGFSFGGAVAAGVARAWGARVARLSLIGPGGFGRAEGRRLVTRSRGDTDGSDAAHRDVIRHNLAATMFADPATVDAAVTSQQLWNIAHTRYDSLNVSLQQRLQDDLAHIACPVQAIWGARDAYAYPSPAERAERVRAVRPDARIHLVPDAGHWAQYERPDAIVRLLLDFHAPHVAPSETS